MTDIRTLLRDAAPRPRTPLDVDALLARPPRRLRTWIASALAVAAVGAGVAGSGALSPASEGGAQVATRRTIPSPSPEQPDVDGGAGPATGGAGRAVGSPIAGGSSSPVVRPRDGGAAAPDPSATEAKSPEPEGCRIERAADRAVSFGPDGNGGLSGEETPSCIYLATRPGGFRGLGNFELEIRRDNVVYRISSRDGKCGDVGVIKAGDDVRVLLHKAANDPPEWYAEAGSNIGCA